MHNNCHYESGKHSGLIWHRMHGEFYTSIKPLSLVVERGTQHMLKDDAMLFGFDSNNLKVSKS